MRPENFVFLVYVLKQWLEIRLLSASVEVPRLAFQGWCSSSVSKRSLDTVVFCPFSREAAILKAASTLLIAAKAPVVSTKFLGAGRGKRQEGLSIHHPLNVFPGSPLNIFYFCVLATLACK